MKKLLTLALATTLLAAFAGLSTAQQKAEEKRQPTGVEMKELPIQVGTVTEKSPAVTLKAVGKEVAPGVFEVDPSSIRGKRLTITPGQTLKSICIGKWKAGECTGIYIQW